MARSLSELARVGFAELSRASELLDWLERELGAQDVLQWASSSANPDQALSRLQELWNRAPESVTRIWANPSVGERVFAILGASQGLAEFFARHPAQLEALQDVFEPGRTDFQSLLYAAVDRVLHDPSIPDEKREESAWVALRIDYRAQLARLAAWDLLAPSATDVQEHVSQALADLAGAAIDAGLRVATAKLITGENRKTGGFPRQEVEAVRLAVIGMGKAGAQELNYVSDVDVIFVSESFDPEIPAERILEIATRLAQGLTRAVSGFALEPELWELDANLRPEGKDGALVRTLDAHVQYYERWAHSWEFQALLKARPLAGDRELGERYIQALKPLVWQSVTRDNFVESVQRMRERVTENIPAAEVDRQLKLGPGGLRDVEFTVQLLQLVHGREDDQIRMPGTLPALAALSQRGYVGRAEAAEFAEDYRFLRVLEHRLQLARLRRTHLMPTEEAELRELARGSGFASNAADLVEKWHGVRQRVRGLHEKLFYRPLLAAVAAVPAEGFNLSNEQAADRLAAIGFRDPMGALAHLKSLTSGVSRRAAIHRTLLPVMLSWLAEGADPDYGLLVYRRLSETLGETHWYLRMLRDSSVAAYRLSQIVSGSRFVAELLELAPESVAWLEHDEDLRPRSLAELHEESIAFVERHPVPEEAAPRLRALRRRETLRLSIAALLEVCTVEELAAGLTAVTENHVRSLLDVIRRGDHSYEFAVIAMGRFGGRELGMGSDADVLYVYRGTGDDIGSRALSVVTKLVALSEDPRLPFELDADLRPEGRNGVLVRSLEAYEAYYKRWSLTWEAQALLRARFVAGDFSLGLDFEALADRVRYPETFGEAEIREVRRIKARVENERLPQGADPYRHVKLGRGSLSDVEWFVQLLQLQHAAHISRLQTTSTLKALEVAAESGLVSAEDAATLASAWLFASRARSALTLWLNKTSDVLPRDRADLEGVARLLGYAPGSATAFEEDYLSKTRRARAVFEREFYGPS